MVGKNSCLETQWAASPLVASGHCHSSWPHVLKVRGQIGRRTTRLSPMLFSLLTERKTPQAPALSLTWN